MEHHVTWFTVFLNKIFGKFVLALLAALHIKPHDPAHPIPEHVAMSLLVILLAMVGVLWLKRRLSVDRPGAAQQVAEMLLTNPLGVGIRDLLDNNVGHHGRQFLSFVGTVGLFILLSNAISLIPAFTSPTVHPSVPLACALLTFGYYHVQGVRHVGAGGYAKHFAGPALWLAWLMVPVELISHTARILSLTVRLYANIFSSELLYATILGLLVVPTTHLAQKNIVFGGLFGILPATLPVIVLGLHAFVAVMQAFVFTILPCIYLSMATSEEH